MPRNILTQEQAVEIYARKIQGRKEPQNAPASPLVASAAAVANEYNVSPKAVRDIWNRRSWTRETRHLWQNGDLEFIRKARLSVEKPAYPLIGLTTSGSSRIIDKNRRKSRNYTSLRNQPSFGNFTIADKDNLDQITLSENCTKQQFTLPIPAGGQSRCQPGCFCTQLHSGIFVCSTNRVSERPHCGSLFSLPPLPGHDLPLSLPYDPRPPTSLAAALLLRSALVVPGAAATTGAAAATTAAAAAAASPFGSAWHAWRRAEFDAGHGWAQPPAGW